MFDERVPDKIVVFYDKENEGFLIRVVDENWNDIIKYDTLPPLCRLSDFYVDVVEVDTFEEGSTSAYNTLRINDVIVFAVNMNGDVLIGYYGEWTSHDYRNDKDLLLNSTKHLFGITV